jgi:concentrative nucleoside transporter, CNT family
LEKKCVRHGNITPRKGLGPGHPIQDHLQGPAQGIEKMHLQGILGLIALTSFCWAISENRSVTRWKTIFAGFIVPFALALIMLKIPGVKEVFGILNHAVMALDQATNAGTSFVSGYVGGGSLPFEEKGAGSSFIFAFKALPLVLVISALSSVLFYWRVLPLVSTPSAGLRIWGAWGS